ncbi:hypothetical protein KI387_023349 [Taxus chinensis]|uniref:Uncharacterized protein n=1 Tax=Taxus chinensis TaxID=29808 RepID=A0AA38LBP7_TAXCH|nr:hypothetical protein KI387_023349 [Taxus chinensis]
MISTNIIADAIGLSAAGDVYFKCSLCSEMQDFIAPGDKPVKYLSGYTRDSLPPPWDRIAEVIMRYFTIDGRYLLVYGPHFFILLHLCWDKKINLAVFIFQSLDHFFHLARNGEGAILHQGLVNLISSTLNKLQRAFTTLKACESFTDTTRIAIAKDCFELLALTDQLAEDSGSPRAKNVVTELKKLI